MLEDDFSMPSIFEGLGCLGNPESGIMDFWKKFTSADAMQLIVEVVDDVKPHTINTCQKPL